MVERREETIVSKNNFIGLSTDTKPTDIRVHTNDTFLELNTKKLWIYSEHNINPTTTNG